jgi:hypothetical protein
MAEHITDPEAIELLLKAAGIENWKEVAAELKDVKTQMDLLKGSADAVKVSTGNLDTALPGIGQGLLAVGKAAENVTGTGDGEAGSGGLAGVAGNLLKIERAGMGLATGHGLRGAINAMEGLALAAGGPAGVGLAIGVAVNAIDVIIPKLEAWIDKINGVTAATKEHTKQLQEQEQQAERTRKAVEKTLETPSKEEKKPAGAIDHAIKEFGGPAVRKAIEDALVNAGGDFGEEANRQFTEQLIANVQAGNRRAIQYFKEIMAFRPGSIAETLRSGKTPMEQAHGMLDWGKLQRDAEAKQQAQFAAEDKAHPEGGPPDLRPKVPAWVEKEAQQKALEARHLSNQAAKAFDQQAQQQGRAEVQADRQHQRAMEGLHREMERIVGLSARGLMDQQQAAMMLASLSGQIDQLIAIQRRHAAELRQLARHRQNRTQQNDGGNP